MTDRQTMARLMQGAIPTSAYPTPQGRLSFTKGHSVPSSMANAPAQGSHGFTLQLVMHDGDTWWKRAVDAGCTVAMQFGPQPWGDRYGRLKDPFGLDWTMNEPAPHKR